jgi:heterogeneous nuclear rnp K-like protein 2
LIGSLKNFRVQVSTRSFKNRQFKKKKKKMSSPSATGATKRPLEDSSSPNVKDEHDSKRPALDKSESRDKKESTPTPIKGEPEETEGLATGADHKDIDTHVPDAPQHGEQKQHQQQQTSLQPPVDESQWIHIRALITSAEAATVIGKGGENVTQIRKMAEAKCTVSDYQRGAGERILTVSGAVDAVAKVSRSLEAALNASG